MNKISIIIPMLNEAAIIEKLLLHLIANSSTKNIAELIVVDGGSTDGSQNIVSNFLSGLALSRPNRDLSTSLRGDSLFIKIRKRKGKTNEFRSQTSNR